MLKDYETSGECKRDTDIPVPPVAVSAVIYNALTIIVFVCIFKSQLDGLQKLGIVIIVAANSGVTRSHILNMRIDCVYL